MELSEQRHGNWDDAAARVEEFALDRLDAVVASFEQQSLDGSEFIDVPETASFARWSDRLSLDWRSEPGAHRTRSTSGSGSTSCRSSIPRVA
jgi:hypothetical protein